MAYFINNHSASIHKIGKLRRAFKRVAPLKALSLYFNYTVVLCFFKSYSLFIKIYYTIIYSVIANSIRCKMSDLSLGQFLKNVFDYSTGKPVQQQPGKVANENFQRAQNEAMKMVQQTAQNITQNFVQQQNILQTQMMLKELSRTEQSWLMKHMFDFPENIAQLLEQIVTNGKTVSAQELASLMKQELDISKILVLLQTNGKTALEKVAKMIATMNQSGIFNTQQLKEMSVLINACIPANDASQTQILKSLMIMYLPWLPINESVGFNFGADSAQEGQKGAGEDTITILITTKTFGLVKIFLFMSDNGCNMDINCSQEFPKDRFNEAIKGENALHLNEEPVYTVRKTPEENTASELKVEFSKSAKITPQLLIIVHAIIKIVTELDNSGSLAEKRKENL